MTWFANRSLATKNLLAAASILAIMVGIGGFAVLKLAAVNDSTLQIANKSLPSVRLSTLIKNDIGYCRIAVLKHTLATTPEQMTKIEDERKQILIDVNAHLSQFEALINSTEERDTFAQLKSALGRYVPSADEVIAASRTDKALANRLAIGDTQKYFQEATDALNHLLDIDVKDADRARIEADAIYANARHLILIVLVFAVAIGAVQSFVLSRSIARPVLHLAEVAEAIAAGNVDQNVQVHTTEELGALANSFRRIIEVQKSLDHETREIVQASHAGELDKRGDAAKFEGVYRELVQGFNQTLDAVIEPVTEAAQVLARVAQRDLTPRVQGNYQGDHAKIKSALNLALDNLEQALSQAAVGAEQVTSAATQIANGSQSLAQGASEQASSLEEVSSSLEEMASMTRQNAENSNQGKLLAGEARGAANRGNEAMQRMAGAIDKIKSSSDATAKIVKTIDEIAFQTNLLALNAAVEAARAGEAGKGFAVVAEEVRNLAQRSAEAAKNTANMIEESVKNADGGVRITEEVAKTLGEIGEASNKVNDLVAEIAAASAEQSKGIEQINLAVNQLDKLTQQNAANSEESASAAEELNSQAQSLSQTVAQFQLRAQAAPKRLTEAPAIAAVTELTTTKRTKKRKLIGATRAGSKLLPLDEDDFKGF